MIEFLLQWGGQQWAELRDFVATNYDPLWDTLDILVVFLAFYWLLLLVRGTRAVQIMLGLVALVAIRLFAEFTNLATITWILDNFLAYAPLMIVVLFQTDIRRALARVGRGFFPRLSQEQQSQILEEVVRAAQALAERRVGALIVLERETTLTDLIDAGAAIDSEVSKELLASIFQTQSPLHDGAVVVAGGRLTHAGCILPLTLRTDLPDGLGTRHRAAIGITEESDAVVVVISEETSRISVVHSGELSFAEDAAELRRVLTDLMKREPSEGEEDAVGSDPDGESTVARDRDEERTAEVVKLR